VQTAAQCGRSIRLRTTAPPRERRDPVRAGSVSRAETVRLVSRTTARPHLRSEHRRAARCRMPRLPIATGIVRSRHRATVTAHRIWEQDSNAARSSPRRRKTVMGIVRSRSRTTAIVRLHHRAWAHHSAARSSLRRRKTVAGTVRSRRLATTAIVRLHHRAWAHHSAAHSSLRRAKTAERTVRLIPRPEIRRAAAPTRIVAAATIGTVQRPVREVSLTVRRIPAAPGEVHLRGRS
jgi:hypothetical protein